MDARWHLSHARGYLELDMLPEAAAELEALPKDRAMSADALSLRITLYQKRCQWRELTSASAALARQRPEDAGAWIIWAYATRRAQSLEDAERILDEAKSLHPKEATIAFNLGCYHCQRGDFDGAARLVAEAIALDSRFQELASTDPDLAPLRQAGLITGHHSAPSRRGD
ncbi:MAG: hypothetical protein KBA71_12215 [Opitutaceae bacterium]|nr:hypothetical protein [Opitutaceae bacterium]